MTSTPYDVREVTVRARPVAGVRAQVPRDRVAQEFGRYLDQVYAAARAGAVQPRRTEHFHLPRGDGRSTDCRFLLRCHGAVHRCGGGRPAGDPTRRCGNELVEKMS